MTETKIIFTKTPYDEDVELYETDTFVFKPGVTILVGPNGAGKSTLLNFVHHTLSKSKDNLCLRYNNLEEGASYSISNAISRGQNIKAAEMMVSSEGENIVQNMGNLAGKVGLIMRKNTDNKKPLYIFLDAVDSGLSIDRVDEIKEILFPVILENSKGVRDVYIIVSANAYEFCDKANCLDVKTGKYLTFKNYNDYKKFILSRINN